MKTLLGLAAFAAVASIAVSTHAQAPAAPAAPPLSYGAPITLDQAKTVMAAAEAEARRNGANVSIAIVEPSGTLVMFERMTDANYSSADGAPLKARSAAMWKRSTATWIEPAANSAAVATQPNAIASNGGEPILAGGKIIGAIGVSGNGQFEGPIAKMAGVMLNR